MTELQSFDFHGDRILLLDVQGQPEIVLKPALEALGVDYWRQIEKLRRRSWAATHLRGVQVPDQVQRREMVTCDVRTFLMLLATIDETKVAERIRPKLIAYQSEVADAIHDYWTKGRATNPRVLHDREPLTFTWEELAAVLSQRHFINLSVVSLTRTLRSAGVLKQTGSPRKEYAHLFWFSGSAWLISPTAVAFLAAKAYDTITRLEARGFLQIGLTEVDVAAAQLELEGTS
ncbi:phage antirepressor N-terminal domain-containing protein [Spirillospora sp. NPDC048911]|uniref:phage antirepressor N-terminal domain-containing protein n=1 Tax=Spirillospora sp. NPDC048911 TaxID=3364527 RepID=UPI003721C774